MRVRVSGVYVIRCEATGQVYVGRSRDVEARWLAHHAELRRGAHCNAGLQAAWRELGEDAFSFELVERVGPGVSLPAAERRWIERLGARESGRGFNVGWPERRVAGQAAWQASARAGGWRSPLRRREVPTVQPHTMRNTLRIKNILRVLRAERDWSQGDLAAQLGVSRQTVNALETGKYDPSLPLAFKIARLFGKPIEEVFTPDDALREASSG